MDETENERRRMVHEINSGLPSNDGSRYLSLVMEYGAENVYDDSQVSALFEIVGFMSPFVVAVRKSDGVKGCMHFCHSPRYYFDFQPV